MRAIPILACLTLAACAPAQMRLPTTLAEAPERTEFAGIGGRPSGEFVAGPYRGKFKRSLDQFTFFETDVDRVGRASFTVAGPAIGSTIEGRCGMIESAVDLGVVEVTSRPMAYGCHLTAEGRPVAAGFELREVVGGGSAITRYERRGEISIGGTSLQIRSVHNLAGTAMPSLTPVGYLFEQDGRQIAALELTGRPALIGLSGLDGATARTVVVGAVALAIFWDPAVVHAGI